ncbi:MAG TPA: hypothetical protein VII22_18820, partial [Streptosporangiaceae bacterium]
RALLLETDGREWGPIATAAAIADAARRRAEGPDGPYGLLLFGNEAAGQLRDMLALGATSGVLLETDGSEWGPTATAAAIAAAALRPAPG